jgi:Ca-activated chloride channel family protein
LTVEQHYQNASDRSIEAVFSFPVPLRSVLLGLELEIGERKHVAQAFARRAAMERYEQAIDSGDTAVLLESNGEGLHTVSIGNLAAGERALVRYRYAEILDAHRGHVRLNVPTAIAPRHGNPGTAGLDGPAVPAAGLLVEYPFEIRVDLAQLDDASAVRSPSHRIAVDQSPQGLAVTLAGQGFLDRDFVLEIAQAALPVEALVARDGDQYVVLASTTVEPEQAEQRPLALKILVDCSGSMAGDSIAAAKRALLAILQRLTPADRISVSRFGNEVEQLTDGMEPADQRTLKPLELLVRRIEADLGGTEMADALEATLGIERADHHVADLILITDGEIYDLAGVIARVDGSRHRLFAIAIGAAPNEALARSLAERNGGACEFVAPGEDAEAAILRTFQRLRTVPRVIDSLAWPSSPAWTAPLPTAVFAGDTLHFCAGFAALPPGDLSLHVRDATGGAISKRVSIGDTLLEGDALPRLAAMRRLAVLDDTAATDFALRYQLATRHTSLVIVAERAAGEKLGALPMTIAVPQMLAAGWGGHGTVRSMSQRAVTWHAAQRGGRSVLYSLSESRVDHSRSDHLEIPAFLREPGAPAPSAPSSRRSLRDATTALSPDLAVAIVESLAAAFRTDGRLPASIDSLLASHPLTLDLAVALRALVDGGESESDVLAVFYAALGDIAEREGCTPGFVHALRGGGFARRGLRELRARVRGWLR